MNDSTLLEYLNRKILEEAKAYEIEIASGRPKDYADYKHLCGIHRGLLIANDLITEIKERMDKDDE
jgi:hypothetical protein